MNAGFALLQRFLRQTSGLALEADKLYLIEDRLRPILRAANLSGIDDLARSLHVDPNSELARSVAEILTINETSFFRDKPLFTAFAERLLPSLIAARRDQRRLRIWCAGCSTGQEPYSLAMLIDDHMRQLTGWQTDIVATDLSRSVIENARRGRYSQFEVQRGLPVAMLLRNFRREQDVWQISDYLRAKVQFQTLNLMSSFRDLGRFDIIFCRNVLIYFDVATKSLVLKRIADALADDGFLALGAAERVGGLCDTLRPDASHQFIFVKEPRAAAASSPHKRMAAV